MLKIGSTKYRGAKKNHGSYRCISPNDAVSE